MGRAAYDLSAGAAWVPAPSAAYSPVSVRCACAGQGSCEQFTVIAAYGLPSPMRAGRSPPVVVESQF